MLTEGGIQMSRKVREILQNVARLKNIQIDVVQVKRTTPTKSEQFDRHMRIVLFHIGIE